MFAFFLLPALISAIDVSLCKRQNVLSAFGTSERPIGRFSPINGGPEFFTNVSVAMGGVYANGSLVYDAVAAFVNGTNSTRSLVAIDIDIPADNLINQNLSSNWLVEYRISCSVTLRIRSTAPSFGPNEKSAHGLGRWFALGVDFGDRGAPFNMYGIRYSFGVNGSMDASDVPSSLITLQKLNTSNLCNTVQSSPDCLFYNVSNWNSPYYAPYNVVYQFDGTELRISSIRIGNEGYNIAVPSEFVSRSSSRWHLPNRLVFFGSFGYAELGSCGLQSVPYECPFSTYNATSVATTTPLSTATSIRPTTFSSNPIVSTSSTATSTNTASPATVISSTNQSFSSSASVSSTVKSTTTSTPPLSTNSSSSSVGTTTFGPIQDTTTNTTATPSWTYGVVGGVVGLLFLASIVAVACCVVKRRQKPTENPPSESRQPTEMVSIADDLASETGTILVVVCVFTDLTCRLSTIERVRFV